MGVGMNRKNAGHVSSWQDELLKKWRSYTNDKDNPDRQALAELRRGLGKPPGSETMMYKHILVTITPMRPNQEIAAFIVGSLYGLCWELQEAEDRLTFASSLRKTEKSQSFEKRFVNLYRSDIKQLPFQLAQSAKYIKSKRASKGVIEIDWRGLIDDVANWDHPDRYVQRRWARDWWSFQQDATDSQNLDSDQNEDSPASQ